MKAHWTATLMPNELVLTGAFKHYSSMVSITVFTGFKTTAREIHKQQG